MAFTRKLGSLNIEVSALDIGCWEIQGTAGNTNFGVIEMDFGPLTPAQMQEIEPLIPSLQWRQF